MKNCTIYEHKNKNLEGSLIHLFVSRVLVDSQLRTVSSQILDSFPDSTRHTFPLVEQKENRKKKESNWLPP